MRKLVLVSLAGGARQPSDDQRRRHRKLAGRKDVLVRPPLLGLASRLASLQSVAVLVRHRIGAEGTPGASQFSIANLIRSTPLALAVIELHLIEHPTLF